MGPRPRVTCGAREVSSEGARESAYQSASDLDRGATMAEVRKFGTSSACSRRRLVVETLQLAKSRSRRRRAHSEPAQVEFW
jgi:hypothetical protein